MKDILKRVVYDYRLKNLKGYFAHEFVPDKNPLIISGSPRGGTTWLYEVIEKSTNDLNCGSHCIQKLLEIILQVQINGSKNIFQPIIIFRNWKIILVIF